VKRWKIATNSFSLTKSVAGLFRFHKTAKLPEVRVIGVTSQPLPCEMEGENSAGWRIIAANEEPTHVIDAFKENALHLEPQIANLNSYTREPSILYSNFIPSQEAFEPVHLLDTSDWAAQTDLSWQGTSPKCVNFEQGLAEFSPLWEPTTSQYLSSEQHAFDHDKLSATYQEASESSGELPEPMASSSTTQSGISDTPSAQISTSIIFSNQHFTNAFPQTAVSSSRPNSKKRRHCPNSRASNGRKKPEVHPMKALARFKREIRSNKKVFNPLKHQLRIMFDQLNQLFDRETWLSDGVSEVTGSSATSQEHESNLDSTDSEEQSDVSSNSATPRQPNQGSHEDTLIEVEPVDHALNLKRFQCTYPKCNYSSERQGDWERHEAKEKHWPQERFMCLLCNIPTADLEGNPMCRYCSFPFSMLGDARTHYLRCGLAREGATTFGRKDHLCEHLRADHSLTNMSEGAQSWSFPIYSEWPRQCGFYGIFFDTWEQRTIHIGRHYQNGAHKSSWKLPFPQPKDDMPHGLAFDPSDDDSDDEDDDFSNGHPPHGKGPSHTFQHTSSGPGSSYLPPSTYQQKSAQMHP
jgi:hypothetical protein